MEKLNVIKHPQFGQLSVIIIDGKEMFKAKEVAAMLGYKDTINAIKQHCKGVVKHNLPTKGGKQEVNLIPEGDVWRLIIRSKLPQAEAIEKWIMDEVLPSIRRTGSYSTPKAMQEKQLELYNYVEKTYFGKPVLTVADAVHFTGIDEYRIDKALKLYGNVPNDYKTLRGSELAAFKLENKMLGSTAKSYTVITESGFDIICRYYSINVDKYKLFIEQNDSKLIKRPTKSMNSLMEYVCREANAIIGLSYLLNTMDTKENLELYRQNMIKRINNLHGYVLDVKTIII